MKTFKVVNGNIQVATEFYAENPSWMKAETSFEKIPLKQVLAEFERQYGVSIEAENIDENQLFTGTFSHNNIDIALKSITLPLHLKYSKTNNTITLKRD